jgi:hypothetical protein
MKIYHGTSYENYLSIMKEGFSPKHRNWNCSSSMHMYFYNPKFIMEYEGDELEDDMELMNVRGIEYAFNNARFTAAFNRSNSDKVIVLELDIEEDCIVQDLSCGAMDNACQVSLEDLSINKISRVFVADYSSNISLLYLRDMNRNKYCDLILTEYELLLLTAIDKLDYVPEEIYEVSYKEQIIS